MNICFVNRKKIHGSFNIKVEKVIFYFRLIEILDQLRYNIVNWRAQEVIVKRVYLLESFSRSSYFPVQCQFELMLLRILYTSSKHEIEKDILFIKKKKK